MAEPFLAEIKIVGFNFPPRGWAQCDGAILPINQNQSLYSLMGTTYGGDGRTTFALPDLRGRAPTHDGDGINLGQRSGQESVTLTASQLPSHSHTIEGITTAASSSSAAGNYLATTGGGRRPFTPYGPLDATSSVGLNDVIQPTGNQPHNNMQPSLVVNFIIALQGLFPSRN